MSTIVRCTSFPIEKFNRMIGEYIQQEYPVKLKLVSNYEEFVENYPAMDKDSLSVLGRQLLSRGKMRECYIVSTSGTTSGPIIVANKFVHGATENSYPYQVRQAMAKHVFSSCDIVANLLTAGGLGNSYEGMCRLLEGIGATILPIGRPDVLANDKLLLDLLLRFSANVLVGSPSGIVQLAQVAQRTGTNLPINKIVFVGERFHQYKREFVLEQWPDAKFYSIYGATELGFAAINTPYMDAADHLILKDWFFMEIDENGELYITDLKSPIVPIIRYKIGDFGEIIPGVDGDSYYLRIGGRVGEEFSVGGHRINLSQIREKIIQTGVDPSYFQVTLMSSEEGRERIKIALDVPKVELTNGLENILRATVLQISKLAEAVSRNISELEIASRESFTFNSRQKLPSIIDLRSKSGSPHDI